MAFRWGRIGAFLLCLLPPILGALWWWVGRGATDPARRSVEEQRLLSSLPYASSSPLRSGERNPHGVVRHDKARAWPGINVYSCRSEPGALFLDMQGKTVYELVDKRKSQTRGWELVEPYFQDGFVVLIEDRSLFRIAWDSNVIWERRGHYHHDVSVAENGDIYAVMNRKANLPSFTHREAVLDNILVVLSPDGEVKKELSLARLLAETSLFSTIVHAGQNDEYRRHTYEPDAWDLMHTNTVEVIERDVRIDGETVFTRGQVLFCMRHLDIVGVVDLEKEQIVWFWGRGQLDMPHHPTLLTDGQILVFDNGMRKEQSRVIELNPLTLEFVICKSQRPFFTASRGSAQRLPNGNTLVVESDRGRVLELTKDGEVVWEFHSFPSRSQPGNRDLLYRMPRLVDSEQYPRLQLEAR